MSSCTGPCYTGIWQYLIRVYTLRSIRGICVKICPIVMIFDSRLITIAAEGSFQFPGNAMIKTTPLAVSILYETLSALSETDS